MSQRVTADWQSNPITFAAQGLFAAFGAGTGREMMVYSVIGGILAYILTVFSAGATAVLVLLFTATFFVGAGRIAYGAIVG